MALNDILTSMDGARDALVTAINAKGGSLADNATFYQCADAVGSLSGGTSVEYYKCASMDTEAKTWSGCKAVFDSTAGTWSFESDVTAGLAYTSVTPVVGVIYTIDALVTVASVYTGFYATSSPLNPGSNNSGVWEITASSFLDSNRNAYKAFDERQGMLAQPIRYAAMDTVAKHRIKSFNQILFFTKPEWRRGRLLSCGMDSVRFR